MISLIHEEVKSQPGNKIPKKNIQILSELDEEMSFEVFPMTNDNKVEYFDQSSKNFLQPRVKSQMYNRTVLQLEDSISNEPTQRIIRNYQTTPAAETCQEEDKNTSEKISEIL
jgi:hypothetical protein